MANNSSTLGIDIGGSSVKLALLDDDGRTLALGQSDRYVKPNTAQLISAIRAAALSIGLPPRVESIGLCVPGLMDVERRVITLAVNVPGLIGQQLDQLIADALRGTKLGSIQLVNDAIATGTDVYVSTPLTGRAMVIAMGTGIGAAVLDPHRSRTHIARERGAVQVTMELSALSPLPTALRVEGESSGHFGQIDVSLDDDAPIAADLGTGSLEAYCGAAALRSQFPVPGDPTAIAFEAITPDSPAFRALVRAIRIAHAIYRPNHIVLAGGIGVRLKHLREPLDAAIRRRLTNIAQAGWRFAIAADDFHAARGAARIASSTAANRER